MCHLTPTVVALQQAIPNSCPAKALTPSQRLTIGVQAVAGTQTITGLADEFDVSRKFVYQQAATAQAALDDAFTASATADDKVLFHLPVTKSWLRQVTLGLTLICHSSYRGVVEFCRDLLDVKLSLGTVHNIVREGVDQARPYNRSQNLAPVDIAGLDEIFQNRQPVLVGADIASTYCFLLSCEEHHDADTWALRLLEAQEQGLAPKATIADFGTGIRAGQKLALPDVPCRGDLFHLLKEITPVVTYLENRAYDAIAAHDKLEQKKIKLQRQARRQQLRQVHSLSGKAFFAAQAEAKAIALADDVACLARWLHYEVFAVSGLPYEDREALFDFILSELQAREPLCRHRLGRLCSLLKNHRDQFLAFAAQLEQDLAQLASDFEAPVTIVRQVLDLQALEERQPRRWQKEAALRQQLGHRCFHRLQQAVHDVAAHVVRASSVIENINSRLRNYFFLHRQLGSEYLELLQFFLNHRRFLRSEHADRVNKSPKELLTGQSHAHWLKCSAIGAFPRTRCILEKSSFEPER
ncbi:MAG TPA: hypothetical protein VNB49_12510 [Candidatus Dormibacteraeota bacterium]|nr:hypothetical protein [Candidatus Dormibacteraeota bacterium]